MNRLPDMGVSVHVPLTRHFLPIEILGKAIWTNFPRVEKKV
jgi:hypothetical protein